jgi:hypothetical protein
MLTILPAARLMTAALSQVASQDIGNAIPSWVDIAIMTLVFLIFAFVVLPAVWGRNAELREAAFRVLDRILRALLGR